MILVTGGTGFIGKALVRRLVDSGYPVRLLLRPSPSSPTLPRSAPVEVALSGLNDPRGLRAALVGVDTVYHLASGEWKGPRASLMEIDIQGTQAVCQAAHDAGVKRIFYMSHLGADRASAFPLLKAKAIAEEHIRQSEIPYTILRSAIVFGPNDGFTSGLARLLYSLPAIFFVPGDGKTLLQPLWIEDLVTCLLWARDHDGTINQTFSIGGPEYLTLSQIITSVLETLNIRRQFIHLSPPYLRSLTVLLEAWLPGLPVSVYWIDYLAANRTTSLDTLPRVFNLMPGRFSQLLAYLRGQDWRISWRSLLRRS